jgi:signal transduction histidine kinase
MAHELGLIVREAVANAVRHGGASEIAIALDARDSALRLSIADNGKGFPKHDPARRPWTISERVRGLGGSLSLPEMAEGARLEITLPVEARR